MKKFLGLLIIIFTCFVSINVLAYEKRVLVIELDPDLKTKGEKVSEFLDQKGNVDKMINNLKDDIKYSSNGNVTVNIVGRQRLNEFPTYKQQVTLTNGSKSYRFDEDTYLSVFNNGWYGWWSTTNPDFKEMDAGKHFDYDYFINKFDLVNRRNKNEFNEVWIIGIDPLSAFETAMVGRTAFWLNGSPVIKDCDNFIISGFTISRIDSPLECLGHASEQILKAVFQQRYDTYKPGQKLTKSALNEWELFNTTMYNTGYSQVGTVHHAPNSTKDYDWLNSTYVDSGWIDWRDNYPNLTGKTVKTNYKTWNSSGDDFYAGRYYHRWWFSLMPHVGGKTRLGFSNNWWDYLTSYDYVTSVLNKQNSYTYTVGDKISNIGFNLKYQSGKTGEYKVTQQVNGVFFEDESLVSYSGGSYVAKKAGTTKGNGCFDGRCVTFSVTVNPAAKKEEPVDSPVEKPADKPVEKTIIMYEPSIKMLSQSNGVTSLQFINNSKNSGVDLSYYRYYKGNSDKLPDNVNWINLDSDKDTVDIKGYGLYYIFVQAVNKNTDKYETASIKILCEEEKKNTPINNSTNTDKSENHLFTKFSIADISLDISEDKYEYVINSKDKELQFNIEVPDGVTYEILDNENLNKGSIVTVVFKKDGFDYNYSFKIKDDHLDIILYCGGAIVVVCLIFVIKKNESRPSDN